MLAKIIWYGNPVARMAVPDDIFLQSRINSGFADDYLQ